MYSEVSMSPATLPQLRCKRPCFGSCWIDLSRLKSRLFGCSRFERNRKLHTGTNSIHRHHGMLHILHRGMSLQRLRPQEQRRRRVRKNRSLSSNCFHRPQLTRTLAIKPRRPLLEELILDKEDRMRRLINQMHRPSMETAKLLLTSKLSVAGML